MKNATFDNRGRQNRRGSIMLLTLIFLTLFASLALAFFATSDLNLRQARNSTSVQSAQTAAESGLAYMIAILGEQSIPVSDANTDLLLAASNAASAAMDGMANLGGGYVTFDGTVIRVPMITSSNGSQFRAEIREDASNPLLLKLAVTAMWQGTTRRVNMDLEKVPGSTGVFNYGVASRGKIVIGGNGKILGVNNPSEADIMSATYSTSEAVSITGSSMLDGDIATANPDSYVTFKGSPTIAGSSNPATFADHVRIGDGTTDFPEVNTTIYEPFIQQTLAASADLNNNIVLNNARIPAGMNPKFNANVTIRGVLYIEKPNQVSFAGGVNIQGVIVTRDAGDNMYKTDTISFNGNVSSQGVETLPDSDGAWNFTGLKALPGSMLLAPGFGVSFSGSFDALNGAIACDKFTMTGNAGGVIRGPIICYGDTEFTLWGSAQAKIDRSYYPQIPPGFDLPVRLAPKGNSYTEG